MALRDCLEQAGYTEQERQSFQDRVVELARDDESMDQAAARLIPEFEQELNNDLTSIREQLGIASPSKKKADAPSADEKLPAPLKDVANTLELDLSENPTAFDAVDKAQSLIEEAEGLGRIDEDEAVDIAQNELTEFENLLLKGDEPLVEKFDRKDVQEALGKLEARLKKGKGKEFSAIPPQEVIDSTESSPRQKQFATERLMSEGVGALSDAVSKAVAESLKAEKTAASSNRTAASFDKNKFIQALDKLKGDNPKARAEVLADLIKTRGKLPKKLLASVEKTLGEPLADFLRRAKSLVDQRELFGKQAAESQQAKKEDALVGKNPDPKNTYKRESGIDDIELDDDGMIRLRTRDINDIRQKFDMEKTKAGRKTINALINEARGYMSTGRENFAREALVVAEALKGSPTFDLDAKMIALRRAIDHMEKSLDTMLDNQKIITNTQAKREQNHRINELREDLHDFTVAYNKIGTLAGRILSFRKEKLKSDFYSVNRLRELMVQAKNGDKLTSTEENFIKQKSKELGALRDEIDRLNGEVTLKSGRALETIAKIQVKKLKRKVKRRSPGKRSKLTVAEAAAKLRNTLNNGPC